MISLNSKYEKNISVKDMSELWIYWTRVHPNKTQILTTLTTVGYGSKNG